jgi:hypothetical protein
MLRVRSGFLSAVIVAALVGLPAGLAWHRSSVAVAMPTPDVGTVRTGAYVNKYFNLSYPLPLGWTEGLAGPAPSQHGYYALSALEPMAKLNATTLIAAQDMFFAPERYGDAIAMAHGISRSMSAIDGMTIDRPPSQVSIAGRRFGRVDFSGVGLFRSTWITQVRCHLLIFNFTANHPDVLATLVNSLGKLASTNAKASRHADPACLANHARTENILTKVDPPAIAPLSRSIPVRIIIAANGSVKHVHVIRATTDQRNGIEAALRRWTFKPRIGRAAELETGLLIKFSADGKVHYLTGHEQLAPGTAKGDLSG